MESVREEKGELAEEETDEEKEDKKKDRKQQHWWIVTIILNGCNVQIRGFEKIIIIE